MRVARGRSAASTSLRGTCRDAASAGKLLGLLSPWRMAWLNHAIGPAQRRPACRPRGDFITWGGCPRLLSCGTGIWLAR
jgi:hypothetical protein